MTSGLFNDLAQLVSIHRGKHEERVTQRIGERTIRKCPLQKIGPHCQNARDLPIGLLPRLRELAGIQQRVNEAAARFLMLAERVEFLELIYAEKQTTLRMIFEDRFGGVLHGQRSIQQIIRRLLAFDRSFEFVHVRFLYRIACLRQMIKRMFAGAKSGKQPIALPPQTRKEPGVRD